MMLTQVTGVIATSAARGPHSDRAAPVMRPERPIP